MKENIINPAWAYSFISFAGMLQAVGAAMGGQLNKSLVHPWLATSISFMLVLFATTALLPCMPRPLPTVGDFASMPWWAPLGGIVGAVAVFAEFMLIQKLGAGRSTASPSPPTSSPALRSTSHPGPPGRRERPEADDRTTDAGGTRWNPVLENRCA